MKLSMLFITLLTLCSCGGVGGSKQNLEDTSVPLSPDLKCALVISQSGVHTLSKDIVVSSESCGVMIEVDNVVLDLNGHKIVGPRNVHVKDYGVIGIDKSKVTVKNGTIDGFAYGVMLSNSSKMVLRTMDNSVENMIIKNSTFRGVRLDGYRSHVFDSQVLNTNGSLVDPDAYIFGIEIFGPDCVVRNNTVVDTYGSPTPGLMIGEGVAISFSHFNTYCVADGNTIYNNHAVTNKSTFGFWVDVYSKVTIKNTSVRNMHYSGIMPPFTEVSNNDTDIPFSDVILDRN